jgi:hypothetical protein
MTKWNKPATIKTLKYTGIASALIFGLMAVLPIFFRTK